MNIPKWVWVIGAIVVVWFALKYIGKFYLSGTKREFTAFMKKQYPKLTIIDKGNEFDVRDDAGNSKTIPWRELWATMGKLPRSDADRRSKAFGIFGELIRDYVSGPQIDPEKDKARLMPRLVLPSFGDQKDAQGGKIIARPFLDGDLSIAYVINREHSVMYVTDTVLKALHLTPEELHQAALANLRKVSDAKMIRSAVESNTMVAVKSMDTFDASRLLLVPEYLKPGEAVAAAVPDRDTLVIVPISNKADFWDGIRKLANTPASDVLFTQPMKVTSAGIEVIKK